MTLPLYPIKSTLIAVDGDSLTENSLTQPTSGSVVMSANAMLSYTPASNFNGSDSFNYTVTDGQGGTIQAPNVRGAAQVFSLDLAFGTYKLQ